MEAKQLANKFGEAPRGQNSRLTHAKGAAIFSEQVWSRIARALNLSGRELQIVHGVFDDKTDLAIAGTIGISPHTVHTHFSRLHRKLGLATRCQIMVHIMREFIALASSPEGGLPPLCGRRTAKDCPLAR